MAREWPEWLTPENTAIKYTIINEMVAALEHCYESADAAADGHSWTEMGWLSVSASNIMSRLRRLGFQMPDDIVPSVERRDTAEVHRCWNQPYDWDDADGS